MAAAARTDFLLFVAGEPDSGIGSTRDTETSIVRRMAGTVVGGWWLGPDGGSSRPAADTQVPPNDGRPWHLPPQQIQCVNLVYEIADDLGRSVAVVDANRTAGRQDLVDRWVGADGLLPLLVRRDGARLQGIEEFVPARVRRFIRGP
ncbi:MAG: hypothetical protein WA688_07350 [Thermoplasmata archaeon]